MVTSYKNGNCYLVQHAANRKPFPGEPCFCFPARLPVTQLRTSGGTRMLYLAWDIDGTLLLTNRAG
mgnify:CR=1 FL=1